ncbi:MAG TPA: hypothetical protein VF829_02845 [Candidatus Paceibacterota bacterium]
MRKDKERAILLRKSGNSYRAISAELHVPLSTLSSWFREEAWSEEVARKLRSQVRAAHTARLLDLNKTRGARLREAYEQAREEAKTELAQLQYDPLFIAGVMLYWGEGDKGSKHHVKLSNTDPKLVRLYVRFLTDACGIPRHKIKAHLLLHPDLEEKVCRAYWEKAAGIPWENFTKSVRIQGRHETRRLKWGVCIVTVSNAYFKQKVLAWLTLLPEALLDRQEYANITEQ